MTMRKWIHLCGALNLCAIAVYAIGSYGLAAHYPTAETRRAYVQFAEWLGFGPGTMPFAFLSGDLLPRQAGLIGFYVLPLAVSTLIFAALWLAAARRRGPFDEQVDLLSRWALAFGVAWAVATPVFVEDFWLSLAWGRMVAGGVNPYYGGLTPEYYRDIPMNNETPLMTYGPLWALISGGVMRVLGAWPLVAALAMKALLGAAWYGCVVAARKLTHSAAAVLIAGWLPLMAQQGVAEGHNDILLACGMALWLLWLERGSTVAAHLALAGSVLIKYVSAPLAVLSLLGRKLRWRDVLAPAALAAACFAPFLRDARFFSEALGMRSWVIFSLAEAGAALGRPGRLAALAARGVLVLITAVATVRYARQPQPEARRFAALAIMTAVLFAGIGHVWPWFLIWPVALAALSPTRLLSHWVVGVALSMPVIVPMRYVLGLENVARVMTLGVYLAACGWALLGLRLARRTP